MDRDILGLIEENMRTFSKGQKKIANFILESYDKAAFMTAGRLGKKVGVSESTVVRFASELGYNGYPDMQKSLQKMIRNRLTAVQRIEVSNDRLGDKDIITAVLQSDIEKIRLTLEEQDHAIFDKTVDAITEARKIYVTGARSAASIASFLSFYLRLILNNVVEITANSSNEIFEDLLRVGPEDVVLGISFPRYSSRTVQALSFAHSRGAVTIAITDSNSSPLTRYADYTLTARSDMASFVDSLVAPLSLINALLVAVSRKKNDDLESTFQKLEDIWDKYGIYEMAEK